MHRFRGLTTIEAFTLTAGMSLALMLMMELGDYVRSRSAESLTSRTLAAVGQVLPPDAIAIAPVTDARANNAELVETLLSHNAQGMLAGLPSGVWDAERNVLVDAWGTPLRLVSAGAGSSEIGMAPGGAAFAASAGPDRDITTRQDNFYSYDDPAAPTVHTRLPPPGPVDTAKTALSQGATSPGLP